MADDFRVSLPVAPAITRMADKVSNSSEADIKKAAHDFESYMLFSIMKELQKSAQLTKKGYMEETYMGVVYEKVADCLAKKGLGVKELLTRYAERSGSKVPKEKSDNIVK